MEREYSELKKKYELPEFNMIHSTFEISLEETSFMLREIRRQMVDKIKHSIEILEEIIHPNSTVSAHHECRFFSDDEKKEVYDLYAKLMGVVRTSNILDLQQEEELDANFIKEVAVGWPSMQSELVGVMHKLKNCWGVQEVADVDAGYFG